MVTANTDQADKLSVTEMLRIMDVATALRQDHELVEEQLNIDRVKALLRDKMIAAAKVTGEEISPEEVDAAINQYYSRLYTFKEPPQSFMLTLAHLYVRRVAIGIAGSIGLVGLLLFWWLFLTPRALMTEAGRTHRRVDALAVELARREATIKSLAHDPAATAELASLTQEAETYRSQNDAAALERIRASLNALEAQLSEEYTVSVASPVKGRSAAVREYKDKDGQLAPRYYIIVQAKRPNGTVVGRRVHDAEKDKDIDVTTWAEQVPKEVYERLEKDKKSDGILDETTYAVKKRGLRDETVTMPGADGRPLHRLSQITEW